MHPKTDTKARELARIDFANWAEDEIESVTTDFRRAGSVDDDFDLPWDLLAIIDEIRIRADR